MMNHVCEESGSEQRSGARRVVRRNLERVRERVLQAARRAGREGAPVRIVAVTKTVAAPIARILVEAGVEDLGENRVQVAIPKMAEVPGPVRWHMIGHVQRNKARRVVEAFHLIHSLDSVRLARVLHEESLRAGVETDVLVQVNVSGEATKGGFPPEALPGALDSLRALASLRIRGFMTMAPFVEDPEGVRPLFRRLGRLRDEASGRHPDLGALALSMGMSQDFEIAVEEGADWIRVGSALFEGLPGRGS